MAKIGSREMDDERVEKSTDLLRRSREILARSEQVLASLPHPPQRADTPTRQ
jgi:hypothetical protein